MNREEFRNRAAFVGYLRVFTNIPYAQQIMDEANLRKLVEENPEIKSDKFLNEAPRFEARFKSLSALIEMRGTNQIIELASGFCSRGLIMTANPALRYVETDLSETINEKQDIIERILRSENIIRKTLEFAEVDVLDPDQLQTVSNSLSGPLTIINEGLFAYFSPEKIRLIAINIYKVLAFKKGVWITPDFMTKNKRTQIPSRVTQIFSGKDEDDDISKNAFESEEQVHNLLSEVGFSVEVMNQYDLAGNLVSIEKLNLDKETIKQALEGRKIYCMATK